MRMLAGVGNIFLHPTRPYYGSRVRGWVWVAMWLCVAAATGVAIAYGITKAVRSAGAASCRTFARTSGYPAAYRIQHWGDGGTCYVTLPNGHALPQKMIVAYLRGGK